MEHLNEALIKVLHQSNLQRLSQEGKLDRIARNELSVYNDEQVTPEALADCIVEIKKAFPRLADGWFDVMEKLLDAEGFTNQRLVDATISMIRNCEFPEPTIARLIGYDKTIKVFTHQELLERSKDYSPQMRGELLDSFDRINFYGLLRFAKKEDIKRYNLTTWRNK